MSKLVQGASFEKMKAHASRAEGASRLNSSDHLRVGKTGTWRDHFAPYPGLEDVPQCLPEAHGRSWARLEWGRATPWRRRSSCRRDGPRLLYTPRGLTPCTPFAFWSYEPERCV